MFSVDAGLGVSSFDHATHPHAAEAAYAHPFNVVSIAGKLTLEV